MLCCQWCTWQCAQSTAQASQAAAMCFNTVALTFSAKLPWQKEAVCQACAVMQDALDPVWKLHEQKHLPLRTAPFVYALENVIKVAKARGYGG